MNVIVSIGVSGSEGNVIVSFGISSSEIGLDPGWQAFTTEGSSSKGNCDFEHKDADVLSFPHLRHCALNDWPYLQYTLLGSLT